MMLKIDIEELTIAMEAEAFLGENFLDLTTGEIVCCSNFEIENSPTIRRKIDAEPDRYVYIQPIGSQVGWMIMSDFVETIEDPKIRSILTRALNSRGPFRKFKDELFSYPDQRDKWHVFHQSRMNEIAKEWLTKNGIEF